MESTTLFKSIGVVVILVSSIYFVQGNFVNNSSPDGVSKEENTKQSKLRALVPAQLSQDQPVAGSQQTTIFNSLPASADAVVYRDGRLSVNLREQPLLDALQRIADQAQIPIEADASEFKHYQVSVQFSDLSLEEGLRRIAHPFETLFLYTGQGSENYLSHAWVFPKSERSIAVTRVTDAIPVSLMSQPSPRAPLSQQAVIESLNSEDETIQGKALLSVINEGVEVPPSYLVDIFQNTTQPPVLRAMALTALVNNKEISRDELLTLMDQARNESDKLLRSQAEVFLYQQEAGQRQVQQSTNLTEF